MGVCCSSSFLLEGGYLILMFQNSHPRKFLEKSGPPRLSLSPINAYRKKEQRSKTGNKKKANKPTPSQAKNTPYEAGRGATGRGGTVLRTSQHFLDHSELQSVSDSSKTETL